MRPSILTFPSSTTTTVTNNLNLQGSGTNRLSLRSSSSGTPFRIDAQGGRVLNSLDVKDSNNINSNIMVADSNSIDSGNNTNWSFGVAPSISFYLDAPSGHITNTNPTYRWKKATPSTNSSITKYELYVQPKDMNTNASIGTPLYIDNIQPSVSNNNGYASYPTYSLHDDGDFLNLTANNYILSPNKYNYRVVAHDSAGNIREESLDFYLDPTTSQTGSSTPTTTLQTNPIPSPSSEPTNTEPTTEIPETTSLLETVNSNISNLNLPSLSVFLSFLTKTGNNIKPVFPLVLLGLLPLLGIITLLTNLGGTPFSWNIISKILQAFGLLPKENASGVVYDTKTGNIVPFAVLTLISSEGDENKIVATLILLQEFTVWWLSIMNMSFQLRKLDLLL